VLGNLLCSQATLMIRQPGKIVGPIAHFLGILYDGLFNFIYQFFQSGSLGVAIILFTVLVKFVLFPLMIKQQKSTFKMQQLQPELNKIREKYKDKKDQQSQQRMAFEMQAFQKENGVSMMGGCLPLVIQLPILYALFYIFQQAYMYVGVINTNYTEIANAIISIPVNLRMEVFQPYAQAFVDSNKLATFDLNVTKDLLALVNHLKMSDWTNILGQLGSKGNIFGPLLDAKVHIETFCGISLVDKAGYGFPGIIIPIFAASTTWLQSKITMVNTPSSSGGADTAAMMSKSMMYTMPIMMGGMTIFMPAGLGLYWTVSNIFTILQQVLLKKYYIKKSEKEEANQ